MVEYYDDPNQRARQREEERQRDMAQQIREWARKNCEAMSPHEIAAEDVIERYYQEWRSESGEWDAPTHRHIFAEAFCTALLARHNRLARKDDRLAATFLFDEFGGRAIRYWSIYNQRWEQSRSVPAEELAAMDSTERQLVIQYLR